MGLTDQTALHEAEEVACTVHPAVLFSIVDHYSRREEEQNRVIGTLLGTIDDEKKVTVCSCFPVPHTETEEQVAVNTDFHATMLQLHQRVFPKQQVVGWYSTGEEVNDSSILFHDFYGQEVERPVHLLLDLGLGESRMSCKAYISAQLRLGDLVLGTCFQDIKLSVDSQADRVGIDTVLKTSQGGDSALSAGPSPTAEVESMQLVIKKLLRTLENVMEYVDKAGVSSTDPAVLRLLQDVVASAPRMPAIQFDQMFNSQVQDMLVVVYLANLTRTQLALAEKLQSVALSSGAQTGTRGG